MTAGPARAFSKFTESTAGVVSSTTTMRQGGVNIKLNVYDFGRTAEAVRGADARVLAARAVLVSTESEILLEGARAYLDVVQGRELVRLNQNSLGLLRRQLDSAQANFARQLATRTDVAQAEARVADAEANLRAAQLSLQSAETQFEELVGSKPGNVSFPAALPALPATREDAIAAATAAPAVELARHRVTAAADDVQAARAELLPHLNLVASDTETWNYTNRIDTKRDRTIGLVLTVPLYQQGAEYAKVRARMEVLAEERKRLADAEGLARQSAVEAWNALLTARGGMKATRSVRANQTAYTGVLAEQQRLGTRSVLDVLNAEQELLRARSNRVAAQRDDILASLRVLASAGRLTAADLALDVTPYDPKLHYQAVRDRWFGLEAGDA